MTRPCVRRASLSATLGEFARPLPLLAVFVLALNDHLLKGAGLLPTWLTGKLSDVAGLFFFPILLFCHLGLVVPVRHRVARACAVATFTGVVFACAKLVPAVHGWVESVLGVVVMDPTDLFALPSLGFSVLYLRRAPVEAVPHALRRRRVRDLGRAFGVALAGLASMATSAPRMARAYPAWEVTGASTQTLACAVVTPFVVQSGKEGMGVVVAVHARAACGEHLVAAHVVVDGARFPGAGGASAVDGAALTVRTYVGFAFDNNALWNEQKRDGTLELEFATAEGPRRLVFDLREAWPATHVSDRGPGS